MGKVYMGRDGFRGISEMRRDGSGRDFIRPHKSGKVYMGSGGVSVKRVLAGAGIQAGGTIRVKAAEVEARKRMAYAPPKAVESPLKEIRRIEPPKHETKEAAAVIPSKDECVPPMDERGNGSNPMSEPEKRLADFLEAAQESKPKCDEAAVAIPELPLGEVPQSGKKKRRKRKSRKSELAAE